MRDIDSSAQHTIAPQHNLVYEYLRQSATTQEPQELFQKFQNLLQQGKSNNTQVSKALEKIIFADESQFYTFLSHCFYTILDSWINRPEYGIYFSQLLNTLDLVCQSRSYDRCRKQLIQLVKNYQQSKSYEQLKLVISLIYPGEASFKNSDKVPVTNDSTNINNSNSFSTPVVQTYLIRYPYLYQDLLPQDLAIPRLMETIKQLQSDRQQDFEILLSKYIIYRFRLKQTAQIRLMVKGAGKIITKVDNPSILSERSFQIALQQYIGKIEQNSTLLERSQRFVAENEYRQTYQGFKQDLHHFLTSNIKPRNNTYQLSDLLQQRLNDIFPQANQKPLNKTQILQTCRQLFSFLLPDPSMNDHQAQFTELLTNLGTAQVMMVLIKLTLICPEAKADLEKKICAIAVYYQNNSVRQARWLLKVLEHLQIAFSIYFGKIDVSLVKSALNNQPE